MIIGKNINKSFGALQVLRDVSIEVNRGEVVSIVGASGAGKSTLLHILGTLDTPDSGEVQIADSRIDTMGEKELARFRNNNIGFVFQFHHLLPEFNALENVCIPAYIKGANDSATTKRAKELLDFLSLSHRLDHKPSELSGGEQQRVAVARALMNEPQVIFADEPSGNLDSDSSEMLHNLFFELRDKFAQTFVIVTHNNVLADMADRKLIMKDGQMQS